MRVMCICNPRNRKLNAIMDIVASIYAIGKYFKGGIVIHILGIIPARGGSKGIIDKNIHLLDGKPMIEYTINATKNSMVDDWFVYTDKYLQYRTLGIRRKKKYSKGEPGSVLRWLPIAIAQYEEKTRRHVDAIVLLQPTCPLRTTEDINDAITLYQAYHKEFNCLVSVVAEPNLKKFYNADGYAIKSQSAYDRHVDKDMYKRNSAIFIIKRSFFDKAHKLFDNHPLLYVMPKMRSVDVDTMDDIELAEAIIQYGR